MENSAIIVESFESGLLPVRLNSPRLKVLILDDSEFDRSLLQRLIKQTGRAIDVSCCSNLEQFEQAIENEPFDICLVDHHLGDASGLDAVKVLKRSEAGRSVPIIMISGQDSSETVVQSMKAGCVDYLSKRSLTVEHLQKTISDALSKTFSDPAMANEVRTATQHVIAGISNGCIKELKPKLSRIYRQIAFVRACETRGFHPSMEAFDDIEEQCLAIWRFFDEIVVYGQGLTAVKH